MNNLNPIFIKNILILVQNLTASTSIFFFRISISSFVANSIIAFSGILIINVGFSNFSPISFMKPSSSSMPVEILSI